MNARRPLRLLHYFEPQRTGHHRDERHLVEPVLLGGIRFAVSHRLPLVAVTVQDTPRLRCAAIRVEVAAVVDPEDRCGRDSGRFRKVVFDPVGGSHVRVQSKSAYGLRSQECGGTSSSWMARAFFATDEATVLLEAIVSGGRGQAADSVSGSQTIISPEPRWVQA